MPTIELYASKVNQMPGLISNIKTSVSNYKAELLAIKNKATNINRSVCNIDDVISSIQSSTITQDEKIEALETFQQNSEDLISDVDYIDSHVADTVNSNKDEFYKDYSYLKPDCEKSLGEKICDAIVDAVVSAVIIYVNAQLDAVAWCKEHWKEIALVILVVAAIVILVVATVCTGGAAFAAIMPLLVAVANGILAGAAMGGLAGGLMGAAFGGWTWESFSEGFIDGAFTGAIAGGLTGGFGFAAGPGLSALAEAGIAGGSNAFASMVSDLGDMAMKGKKISIGEFLFNTGLSFGLGAVLSPVKLKIGGVTAGQGNWISAFKTRLTCAIRYGDSISFKTIAKNLLGLSIEESGGDFVSSWVQEWTGTLDILPWNREASESAGSQGDSSMKEPGYSGDETKPGGVEWGY